MRREYMYEVDMGDGKGFQARPHPLVPFISSSEQEIKDCMRAITKPKRIRTRVVYTEPWGDS